MANSAFTKSSISTPVTVSLGGTGLATLTDKSVLVGAGTSNVAFVAPGTNGNLLTSNGTSWTSATPSAGGSSFWTAVPGSPARASNTSITLTDTSNAGLYDLLLSRGTILKWEESGVVKQAFVDTAVYGTNTVTLGLLGTTCASIDTGTLKYSMNKAKVLQFSYPGTTSVSTDCTARFYADKSYAIHGAKAYLAVGGTTNSLTVDINVDNSTVFTTKPPVASGATVGTATTSNSGSTIATDSYISVDIDSISTTAGSGLYLEVYVSPLYDYKLA